MAERVSDPRRREVRQGLVSRLLTRSSQGIKWLVLSLLFSILIEWIGMIFWWPEQGLDHSRNMLAAEIGFLQLDFDRSLVSSDPARFTRTMLEKTKYALFEVTGIEELVTWASSSSTANQNGLQARVHTAIRPIAKYLLAAMQTTQVFSVRLAILFLAMPVFLLFSLVAVVEGLVKRDLRRWGGGRESSFVYHWAKRTALPLLVLTWVVYLALPFSLHPSFVVFPFATLFSLSIAVMVSTFKKYL